MSGSLSPVDEQPSRQWSPKWRFPLWMCTLLTSWCGFEQIPVECHPGRRQVGSHQVAIKSLESRCRLKSSHWVPVGVNILLLTLRGSRTFSGTSEDVSGRLWMSEDVLGRLGTVETLWSFFLRRCVDLDFSIWLNLVPINLLFISIFLHFEITNLGQEIRSEPFRFICLLGASFLFFFRFSDSQLA